MPAASHPSGPTASWTRSGFPEPSGPAARAASCRLQPDGSAPGSPRLPTVGCPEDPPGWACETCNSRLVEFRKQVHGRAEEGCMDRSGCRIHETLFGSMSPSPRALLQAPSASTTAAPSFFSRAAQKLNLSSKRCRGMVPTQPHVDFPAFATNFCAVLRDFPPPTPPGLLRAAPKAKESQSIGKVKVMLRISPEEPGETSAFLKADTDKAQVILHEPEPPNGLLSAAARRLAISAPKMFAFDAVFCRDATQAEVCAGSIGDVVQAVVNGADGCVFCFGHAKLGKSYTMIGHDDSMQSLGIMPCAIAWLFRLIDERRERTGARFSVRVSAVELWGGDENLQDLLAGVVTGGPHDSKAPGIYLQEDPIFGTQLQNQSELRAPTPEIAAHYLDVALASRQENRLSEKGVERRGTHMLFTLYVYQYRMDKASKANMSGGRSRLHLIDLGSCERPPPGKAPAGSALSLASLGNVILALVNGAKHIPYRESKLTMLLRESLGNINCRTTMIIHVSPSASHYAETLGTIQLAARIHRMRKKKPKNASSSSGGESSCEEGRTRRLPLSRTAHPRLVALDPDVPRATLASDPDYLSSSEQSCDTVIYVGSDGAVLSEHDLTDNEGPPDFVPIIPSLDHLTPHTHFKQHLDHDEPDLNRLKCRTFAELQERLECIDGSEEPEEFQPEVENKLSSWAVLNHTDHQAAKWPMPTPLKGVSTECGDFLLNKEARFCDSQPSGPPTEISNAGTWKGHFKYGQGPSSGTNSTPGKILHPKKSPNPSSKTRASTIGMSLPAAPLPLPPPPPPPPLNVVGPQKGAAVVAAQNLSIPTPIELDSMLTTMVTLQQPVELNHEDMLVFTLVEELTLGTSSLGRSNRPTSIMSFTSNCSVQALSSGSRPISIISSITDDSDYDVGVTDCTTGDPDSNAKTLRIESRCSSISSWLSEASANTANSEGDQSCDSFVMQSYDGVVLTTGDSLSPNSQDLMLNGSHYGSVSQQSTLHDSGFSTSEGEGKSCSSGTNKFPTSASSKLNKSSKIPGLYRPNREGQKYSGRSDGPPITTRAGSHGIPKTGGLPPRHTNGAQRPKTTSSTAQASELTPSSLPAVPWSSDSWKKRDLGPSVTNPVKWNRTPTIPSESKMNKIGKGKGKGSRSAASCSKNNPGTQSSKSVDTSPVMSPNELVSLSPHIWNGSQAHGTNTKQEQPAWNTCDLVSSSNWQSEPKDFKSCTSNHAPSANQSAQIPRTKGVPPTPPVRKSSLDQKNRVGCLLDMPSSTFSASLLRSRTLPRKTSQGVVENHALIGSASECLTSSGEGGSSTYRYARGKVDQGQGPAAFNQHCRPNRSLHSSTLSLNKADSLTSLSPLGNLNKENKGGKAMAKALATTSSLANSSFSAMAKSSGSSKVCGARTAMTDAATTVIAAAAVSGSKARSPSLNNSIALWPSIAGPRNTSVPPNPHTLVKTAAMSGTKHGRATLTSSIKPNPVRITNTRVSELAVSSSKGHHGQHSGDSDSGNDSGINLLESPPLGAGMVMATSSFRGAAGQTHGILGIPSPYSKVTAPRRPRYSSGHFSDNSSVLSGDLPPAMGRAAIFYHNGSGGSSGYESMRRDSEATGSASSACEGSSIAAVGERSRSLKSLRKRTGTSSASQRQRPSLVTLPPSLPSLPAKPPTAPSRWVDVRPRAPTEPVHIKVYEIDDFQSLERPWDDSKEQNGPDHLALRRSEERAERLRARRVELLSELQCLRELLMLNPNRWRDEFTTLRLTEDSGEFVNELEHQMSRLECRVALCKAHVMMVTCFDVTQ
uniref:kinesin-like protein KIF26B n=1 Tax=Myxine glutinosa TaxID=7769 RepID=UPI00358DFB82